MDDAYRFTPKRGWTRIVDLPGTLRVRAAVPYGQTHIIVFGQNHGAKAESGPRSGHCFAYHTVTDPWVKLDDMPGEVHVDGATLWNESLVVLGRSPRSATARSASLG